MHLTICLRNKKKQLFAVAAFCLSSALALSLPALAQTGSEAESSIDLDDLYYIELLVFAHTANQQDDEHHENPAELGYPEKLLFLKTRQAHENELMFERQLQEEALFDSDTELDLEASVPTVNHSAESESTDLATDADTTKSEETAEADQIIIPPLMVLQENTQLKLLAEARQLKRRSAYRLLFHGGWHQQLGSREDAAAIPVKGGDQYDDQYEITGTVTLSKGRFLHITTDLWFSQFVYRNEFDEIRPWYEPAPEFFTLPPIPVSDFEKHLKIDVLDDIAEVDQAVINEASTPDDWPEEKIDSIIDETISIEDQVNEQENLIERNYNILQTFVLNEYRRMKRDEVHYLDHPKFGVIVIVSKFEVPE